MFLSPTNLISHSKRLVVKLLSAAQTQNVLIRTKSPTKAGHRMCLRKFDKYVNTHTVFYETKVPGKNFGSLFWMNIRHARLTGRGMFKTLLRRAQRKYSNGAFYKYWNQRSPGLASHGGSHPRTRI